MAKKRPSLEGLTSGTAALTRHVAPKGETHDLPAQEVAKGDGADLRYLQTRLSMASLRSIKLLAMDLNTSSQALVLDALNDLMRKHGRAPDITGPTTDERKK